MECVTPIYLANKEGLTRTVVPCGSCGSCLSNRRNEWTFRLKEEFRAAKSAYFVTMTYNDDELPMIRCNHWEDKEAVRKRGVKVLFDHSDDDDFGGWTSTLQRKDVQDFLKRLRASQLKWINTLTRSEITREEFLKWKIRYFIIGEYGPETSRAHYHGLFFNLVPDAHNNIHNDWKHGFINIGTVTGASIHYVTKYFINQANPVYHKEPEFTLMSQGIGKDYLERTGDFHKSTQDFTVRDENGTRQNIPRYYKDKIFTKEEKEANSSRNRYLLEQKRKEDAKQFDNSLQADLNKESYNTQMYERKHKISEKIKSKKEAKKGRTL